jgi:hypothetical protein
VEELGRRTRQRGERRTAVALGDWHRTVAMLSLRSVRRRFLVSGVID